MDLKYIIGIIVVIVVIIVAAAAYGGVFTKPSKITITGSTSVQPVAQALADQYHKEHPKVNITVSGGGSSVGLKSAQDGSANIGMYSSNLTNATANNGTTGASIVQYQIANDGIVVIVNSANNITGLTKDQVKSIFGGNTTNFASVGGNSGAITVVTRESGSGTRDAFISLIMGGKTNGTNITQSAIVQTSTDAIKQAVKGNPNAIGFASLADVTNDTSVKVLKIDGVTPSQATVKDGTYATQRPFLFLTKGNATGETLDFINWVLSPEGQKIVQNQGAVPVKSTS